MSIAAPASAKFVFGTRDRPGRSVWLLLGPCIAYLVIFSIYPLFHSLRLSLTDLTAATGTGNFVGLDNYRALLVDPQFWNAAWNSAVMVSLSVAIQVVLGVALAMFFNLRLRGSWIVRGILLLPMLMTPIVVGVMWRALLNPDWGLVDWAIKAVGLTPPDWLGTVSMSMVTVIMVDCWQWTPFVFMIVFARLQALPQEVFEAAQVDGAGPVVTFRRITLPMLRPAIVFAAVFRAVDAFRSFDLIYGLSYGGPARSTTTLSFFSFQNGFQFQNYGYAAAVAYMMLIILAVGTTVLLQYVQLRPGNSR
ncbi:sugar ABC transporter permease [Mesorhizobium sp. B2-8-3]|uniref:carbohydrate ABC transporter permease n=1 Tax=Mesorhizobium sp. B2-8-3 TaxID=2589905 RepID=UPI001128BFB2|nr:sugar ABC transporter permease [Mesorhizobium sp. B2-8-3]TPJ31299.1 sugar ABC transporter permease [Mesorhizobium sp. B2-8-3]